MRIDRLELVSFGAFHGVEIDFAPGLNLFFGGNEEGKSTLIDGLLLAMLGAPAASERRLRYAPLDREAYEAAVFATTAAGVRLRLERNFAPGGRDRIGVEQDGAWIAGRKAESFFKSLGLPSSGLARSTMVVSGGEVVLAAREDARTVSKAISARVTRDERAVSGQQAIRRLQERRAALENRERKALEEELKALRARMAGIAEANETARRLDEARRAAEERLYAARAAAAAMAPALEAYDAWLQARKVYDDAAGRHTAAFVELRTLRAREDEIALLEREMAPYLPRAAALEGEALARFRQLWAVIQARREAAAEDESTAAQMERELALLREKLALYQRAGFTLERRRILDRLDGAVSLAQKNLRDKEAALAGSGKPVLAAILAVTAVLVLAAGAALALMGVRPGWAAAAAAVAVLAALVLRRGRREERGRILREARARAAAEVDFAKAALMAESGGRSLEAWQEEFAAAQRLEDEIRQKETALRIKAGLSAVNREEEEELAGILSAAGCRAPEEYERQSLAWDGLRQRLQEARSVHAALLGQRSMRDLEEAELALAREEAAARAALDEAGRAAAGLEAAGMARLRQEYAGLDLDALEKEAALAARACEQHRESAMRRDSWEVEAGLAVAEARLADNLRRAEAIRLAIAFLEQAVAEVQGSLVPRIQERAGGLFALLTGGRYEGLAVTTGAEMLEVEPVRAGRALPGRILSSGTADQMYLALRLALAEALQGPEPLPLILDDPFLTFDRPRLGHAVRLLLEIAGQNQVILVTKDEILRDLAAGAGIQARRLPGAG